MSTLDPTSFLFEIAERKPIPPHKLAYFQTRLRYNLYDYILTKFKEMEKEQGLTRAELARRIGCKPEQVTRRLGAPGNWTIDTISDLLIGIAGEELEPQSTPVLNRAKRNNNEKTWRASLLLEEHRGTVQDLKPSSAFQANSGNLKSSASGQASTFAQGEPNINRQKEIGLAIGGVK